MKERKTRGKTLCNNIHARSLEERAQVTFEKGQAVGPCDKTVTELSYFWAQLLEMQHFAH